MIMHNRPQTRPNPVTTPAPGAPPYSPYIPCAAQSPSSRNSVQSSSSNFRRSLTGRRPLARWDSTALAPPPRRIESSSARTAVIKARSASRFALNRGASKSGFDPRSLSSFKSPFIAPHTKTRRLYHGCACTGYGAYSILPARSRRPASRANPSHASDLILQNSSVVFDTAGILICVIGLCRIKSIPLEYLRTCKGNLAEAPRSRESGAS